MDFDVGSLATSLAVSSVGLIAFSYGKKMKRLPQMVAGVVLIVFPYFVSGVGWMLGGMVVVLVGLWLALRARL